ncbi:hypothetical protein CKM354_000131600 [Cercospora kikuchii]|uniref:Chitin-binding type-1 domain-containing protein n=1 Tax=Cercospora kikuchii TaxID=84275 RepID=A0A9P3C809_9PEZI|nr:uncharacterized protein CKM354_000131600 [Cercospora kikuchii]GIZ37886.1 hypothetical protein CKM354_000131600 [Cercospora kikuchii]
MRLTGALLALPALALAQVSTITVYPSSCRATYTTVFTYTGTSSGTRISTTVQSTVTVVPTPFTDDTINSGTPFLVEVQPASYARKNRRQAQPARSFLDINGYLTSEASEAVQYVINNGQLLVSSGGQGQVTAEATDLSVPFAASTTLRTIRATFYSGSLTLGWNNTAFESGAAQFYQTREGSRTRIVVRLNGAADPSWTAVNFNLQPTSNAVQSSTASAVPSSTSAGVENGTSLSILPISTSTASSASGSFPTLPTYPNTTASSSSASATPSSNVDPSGACGAGTAGSNCFGASDGSCCSQYGFCGSGPAYCGAGCQPGYGTCDPVASSSSAAQPPVYGSSSAALPPTYGSSSAAVPPTYESSTAELPPLGYSLPAPSLESTFSGSESVTATSSIFTEISSSEATSTQETYSGPVGTPIVPSQYPTVESEPPVYTPTFETSSPGASETASSLPPIYSSLASSYASSESSSASSALSSISSVLSSASSSVSAVSSESSAASSISSVLSSASSDAQPPQYPTPTVGPSSSLSSASSTASSITSVVSSVSSAVSSVASSYSSAASSASSAVSSVASSYSSGISSYSSAASSASSAASAPSAYTTPAPEEEAGSYNAASFDEESPSQASSCAATAVPNPQFYASATASRASSWLVLPTPTPCDFGSPNGWPIDDSYCNIDVPQGLQVYGSSFTTAFASTNGIMTFGEGTTQFQNLQLPAANIPAYAVVPFWDDTAMFGNETITQGIFYQNDTTGVTFEFYLSRPQDTSLIFHYTISYAFPNPGVFVYSYFDADSAHHDDGSFSTVGMQGEDASGDATAFMFSYRTRSVYPGLVLTCDTNSNICTQCTQDV